MARPGNVVDALSCDDSGMTIGSYGEFTLRSAYQPIYKPNGDSGFNLVGFEGLLRVHKDRVPVSPPDFFRLVNHRDRVFVECLCMALHIHNYRFIEPAGCKLFVNVDASAYPSMEIMEREIYFTFSQISKYGLNRDLLVFEIVETEVLNIEILKRVCNLFRDNGFAFALDDFGTCHSNIERFLEVRPNIVKLDRVLFEGFHKELQTRKLVQSLVNAFRESGTNVLIEGVERHDEIRKATLLDIDMLQGYGLGLPQIAPITLHEDFVMETEAEGDETLSAPVAASA